MSDWSSTRIELGRTSAAGESAGASKMTSPTISPQIRKSMTNATGLELPGKLAHACVGGNIHARVTGNVASLDRRRNILSTGRCIVPWDNDPGANGLPNVAWRKE